VAGANNLPRSMLTRLGAINHENIFLAKIQDSESVMAAF
jgi:hypothetical protein